ncbi:MAG: WD40 repeat domain-containing protein [Planctomycetota bacterium]
MTNSIRICFVTVCAALIGPAAGAQSLPAVQPTKTLSLELPRHGLVDRAPVVSAVAVDAARRRVVTAGDDHMVRVWRMDDGGIVYEAPLHGDWIRTAAVRPDGRMLATAGHDQKIRLWDTTSQRVAQELFLGAEAVLAMCYSPDGAMLAVSGFDSGVRLLDGRTGQLMQTLDAPGNDNRALRFSPDGAVLAVGGRSGVVRLFSPTSGAALMDLETGGRRIGAIAFSPDGSLLACGGDSRAVYLYRVSGQPAGQFPEQPGAVTALEFCGPDRLAVGRSNNTLTLWSVQSAAPQSALTGHTGTIAALCWDAQSQSLLTGGFDTKVRIYVLGAAAVANTRVQSR